MERKFLWVLGIVVAAVLVAMTAARAEDTDKEAAEKAFERGDPDNVDPVNIKGDHWNLDIVYEEPLPILITSPKGEKQVYWYVIYTITNNTGADRTYVPSFILFTDTGQVCQAGVNPAAFEAVKKLRSVKYPNLENAVQMVSIKTLPGEPGVKNPQNTQIKMGDDNARTGVAIFSSLDRQTRKFTIFIQGLSGEYIERPGRPNDKIEPNHLAEGDKLLRLYKTLALAYDLPGDQWWQNLDTPVFTGRKWTWR